MEAILHKNPDTQFRFWGGEKMQIHAENMAMHYRHTSFMGFAEVVRNLPAIKKLFAFAKSDILEFNPDAVILIDYPGFNLRMAKWIKEQGIKVIYYISPQVWAWKKNRVYDIKKYVDEMIVILPFEKEFYKKFDMDVHYVGHPLLDEIQSFKISYLPQPSSQPVLAVLPGSRKQEITKMLPVMIKAASKMSGYTIKIAKVASIEASFYQHILDKNASDQHQIQLLENKMYEILSEAEAALVSSGTATLETALFQVPQVVCYKGSWISYYIGRWLIDLPYISLVNLVMNEKVVPELIQGDCAPAKVFKELQTVILRSDTIVRQYQTLIKKLGKIGASENAAEIILQSLYENNYVR